MQVTFKESIPTSCPFQAFYSIPTLWLNLIFDVDKKDGELDSLLSFKNKEMIIFVYKLITVSITHTCEPIKPAASQTQ